MRFITNTPDYDLVFLLFSQALIRGLKRFFSFSLFFSANIEFLNLPG